MLIVVGLLLSGCSAQVAGMQSPAPHDYGSIDWIPLDREIEQSFITGPGYSAVIENDPGTTSDEYLERLTELPEDARSGDLERLRLGLRLSGRNDMAWNTGARLELSYADGQLVAELAVDDLPRSGERVDILDLPAIESGQVMLMLLVPGDGPDAQRLQVGLTPNRAPYGGWRAVSAGQELQGAIVFDTRYVRDVAAGAIVSAGVNRVADAGAVFLTVFGLTVTGLLGSALWLWQLSRRKTADGR